VAVSYLGRMRRWLGWLCILPALASLTPTLAAADGRPFNSAMQPNSGTNPATVYASVADRAVAIASDYGPATWVPANPANYTVANRPDDHPVQMIIIHDTEGSYATAIQDFQDPSWAASAHYVVSDAGQITQMVAEKDIAWHAGNWDYNTRAIGIEHEGYAWTPGWYTTAMYDASAQLAASICSRWGVPMDRQHVIGHNEVPDPNDPTLFGGSDHHTDPGPYWDWTYYMSKAQADAMALPSPPRMMPEPVAVLTSATSATVSWQPASTCHSPITGYTVTGQPGNLVMNLPANATTATFSGLQAGVTYTFSVTAVNAYGQDSLTAHWRCSVAAARTAPESPQPSGTMVQLSGTSGGCPNPLYQFWILPPGSHTWTIAQPYSSSAAFNWNTGGLLAGNYLYTVWVRDASSRGDSCNSFGCFDAFFPGTAYKLTTQPCTSMTASTAPASPQLSGTSIAITGAASGCPHPLYEFWILVPGGSWKIVETFSTSATFNWDTTGLLAGTYLYTVWVRDSGSAGTTCNSFGCYDALFPGTAYTLTTTSCASVTVTASPAPPQGSGTPVSFTGTAAGCPHPLYQFWILAPGGSWKVVQAFSTTATLNWNTTGLLAGTYLYTVWVRDSGSAGGTCNQFGCYDAIFPGTTYTLTTTACNGLGVTAAPASPQGSGTPVTFTGTASGCPHPLYQFWILAPGGSWKMAQAFSTTATLNWKTTGLPAGNYLYTVWVRDSGSAGTSCNQYGCYDALFPGTAYTLT
jgi:N-acetylmuramoyl-L-alanine amidase